MYDDFMDEDSQIPPPEGVSPEDIQEAKDILARATQISKYKDLTVGELERLLASEEDFEESEVIRLAIKSRRLGGWLHQKP